MASLRIPMFRRPAQNTSVAEAPSASSDAMANEAGPEPANVSYVWLCVFVGAAVSVGIAAGVGLDRAGLTEGAASWMAGAVAFSIALVALLTAWAIAQAGK